MVPFFVAALAVAPPAPAAVHGGAIALVAAGAAIAGVGRALDPAVPTALPVLGAVAFIGGSGAVVAATLLPLRAASGRRRPTTEAAYVAGLCCVMAGVALGGLYLAGVPEVLDAWGRLRVAHAWLNGLGFLPLVIAGTLVHFAPTVAGARIRARASGRLAVVLLGAGAVTGGAGFIAAEDMLVRVGAALLVGGATGLAWHAIRVQLDAVGWSSDRDWHRLAAWSLLAAPAWLVVATVVVGVRAYADGASGASWRLEEVAGPLIAGFAIQVLLGALAHLVPAIGPGGPSDRATARRVLGRIGAARVVTWNLGTAALTVGLVGAVGTLTALGAAALGLAGGAALLSLGVALARR
jgi:nitrite reductase (NO-forming)